MKMRPMLFSGAMVRAILDGTKTQTRRVVKPKYLLKHGDIVEWREQNNIWFGLNGYTTAAICKCPYGKPVDFLWVRETFCLENTYDYHGDHVVPSDGRPIIKHEDHGDGAYWLIPHYRATEPEPNIVPYRCDADDDRTRWTPSIFMPRWASRITLDITDVRIERLQDISEEDCIAEGINNIMAADAVGKDPVSHILLPAAVHGYAYLWECINGPGSWDANPWVWVIEFERVPQ